MDGAGSIRLVARFAAAMLASALLGAALLTTPAGAAGTKPFKQPRVRHVWVIVLENQSYASTFGEPTADPYLAQTLPAQGALLQDYYATGHESNDNYLSLVSGQPPNADTQADCQIFSDFAGGLELPGGVEAGEGCVYPSSVQNIGTQLSAASHKWKAYQQDMGNGPGARERRLRAPRAERARRNAESGAGRRLRHASRPVRLLPFGDRQPGLLQRTRRRARRP
jgi:hypothetical protein